MVDLASESMLSVVSCEPRGCDAYVVVVDFLDEVGGASTDEMFPTYAIFCDLCTRSPLWQASWSATQASGVDLAGQIAMNDETSDAKQGISREGPLRSIASPPFAR